MEEEVQELKSFYELIEETVSRNDNFRTEIVRRLMGAYLYKIGSILHRKQPEFLSENPKSLKREEVLFNPVSYTHLSPAAPDYCNSLP